MAQLRSIGHLSWAFAALGVLLLSACDPASQSRADGSPPLPQVVVSTPLQKTVAEWDEYTGRFAAVNEVEVRPRVGGFLDSVNFRDGDIVRKGDLLFVIDPRPFEAELAAAHAGLAEAESRLELATRELTRASDLRRSQAVSETVLDQREQERAAAQAAVMAARAEVRQAELNLEFTRVTAPISGRVGRHLVSEGNLISGGTTASTLLTTIVSLDPIHIYFDADQAAFLRYVRMAQAGTQPSARENQSRVVLSLPDETAFEHEGRMDFLDNQLDRSTGTIRARATFSNPDLLFTPGLFARIRLLGRGQYDALMLPDSAIGTDQTRRYVFVVGDDGIPQYRPVEIGPLVDGLRVVRSGLEPTERVIVSGLQRVRPGAPVTPVEEPLADAGAPVRNAEAVQ
ncbi:efflux RND transporter periplasmic adaptor subunit [Indioceanicola profundi]|uniref:efflux RND transporter periplasmic adaptor subunit n=1 Tax=Indioceanicola profundi TaxID=2220096 RepID=UPI000E6ADF1A|nr:efflux RND transporter periplasmic adaptor subunit [Indioceanicola profundi]